MSGLIKGTHHVALKCNSYEQFQECVRFYTELLGLEVLRSWGEGEGSACMLNTGNSIIEIFATGAVSNTTGSVNHYSLATDQVDECVRIVREAGYKITVEPKDVVIPSAVPFPIRIAFCVGPVGEEIEFFCER